MKDVFYYVTLMNENYAQSDLPVDRSYLTLGADGFGRSDTRAALPGYFGADAASIARAALGQLA